MQILGLISTLYLAVVLLIMFVIWPPELSKTLSQNAARKHTSIIYYAIALGFFLILFTTYIIGWLMPALSLGLVFRAIFILGVAGQIVALIIPETDGVRVTIHRTGAFVMMLALTFLTGLLSVNPFVPNVIRWFALTVLAWMILSWVVFVFVKKSHRYALIFQLVYVFSFLILALVLAL